MARAWAGGREGFCWDGSVLRCQRGFGGGRWGARLLPPLSACALNRSCILARARCAALGVHGRALSWRMAWVCFPKLLPFAPALGTLLLHHTAPVCLGSCAGAWLECPAAANCCSCTDHPVPVAALRRLCLCLCLCTLQGPVLVRGLGRFLELKDMARQQAQAKAAVEAKVFITDPKSPTAPFTTPQPFRLGPQYPSGGREIPGV